MDLGAIERAYRRYSKYYDYLFGRLYEEGRRQAVRLATSSPGRRILEVGVGTGLSLSHYPDDCSVVGVDVSAPMLEIARRRTAARGFQHVEALLQMDAEQLEMPDGTFDAVVAMYVATVVPNPDRLLSEMRRVCVPGGDLIVVNHFESRQPLMRSIERAASPMSRWLGFRTALPLDAIVEPEGVERVALSPVNFMGLWTMVHYRCVDGVASAAPLRRSRVDAEESSNDLRPGDRPVPAA